MIEVRGLEFGYGREPVLRGLDFAVRRGEVTVLAGPNGAGKSTVIRLLTRVLVPEAGSVRIDGTPVAQIGRRQLARTLAVVPQGADLPSGFRGHEMVSMGRAPHLRLLEPERPFDAEVVERVMRHTDTWRFRNTPVEALSGGEKQRLLMARALAQEPACLLLDEPTSHLDLRYQIELLRFTRREVERGGAALVVLHDLNLAARIADRILLLHQGRLVSEGPPQDVLTAGIIRTVYGADVDVFTGEFDDAPVVLPRLR